MFYLTKNGERVGSPMPEDEVRRMVKNMRQLYVGDWDVMEIDDDDVNAVLMLQDLKESMENYALDWSDLAANQYDLYVDLLEHVLDVMLKHYNEGEAK